MGGFTGQDLGLAIHFLTRARDVDFVEIEIEAVITMAQLHRLMGRPNHARELLGQIWELVKEGPYPLLHADAQNTLAQIERDADNIGAAIDAARYAYQLAWCDGIPFAYHWGLETARQHLHELKVREPDMPPFDESLHEALPKVNIGGVCL